MSFFAILNTLYKLIWLDKEAWRFDLMFKQILLLGEF